jgi:hypothetical protein
MSYDPIAVVEAMERLQIAQAACDSVTDKVWRAGDTALLARPAARRARHICARILTH